MATNRTAEESSTKDGEVASKAIDGNFGDGKNNLHLTLQPKCIVKIFNKKAYHEVSKTDQFFEFLREKCFIT